MTMLGKFLAAKEPLFEHALMQLEERTGKSGVDAALAAEITMNVADRIKQLGLDQNISGPGLHQELVKRVQVDDERLAKALGGSDPTNLRTMVPQILQKIETLDLPRRGFFIKHDVAKQMLSHKPPQQILARLGYNSVEDMLAHEDVTEIYVGLRFAEDSKWLNDYNTQYARLKAEDFEERDIQVVRFDAEKWGDIAEKFVAKKLHNITHSKEMGAIAIMPTGDRFMPGVTLKVMPLILHYYNEVRLYSLFFKLMRTKVNFGQIVATTLIADTPNADIMKGTKIHWRVIQRYFGKLKNESHPEIFEPHVQPEDLHWRKAEEILYELDPQLKFWQDLDYVAALKGEDIISFNLMDVSLSYSNQLSYEDRYIYHFRESLWNEIFARYMGQKNLEQQVLERLNNDFIAPEKLKV